MPYIVVFGILCGIPFVCEWKHLFLSLSVVVARDFLYFPPKKGISFASVHWNAKFIGVVLL